MPGMKDVTPPPYFKSAGAVLYHGESLDLLSRLKPGSVAACITDPPYSSGTSSRHELGLDPRVKYCHNDRALGRPSFEGDNRDQRSFAFWGTLWMTAARRIVTESGYLLSFSDWRQLPTTTDILQAGGWVWRGLIAWDKGPGSRAPHKGFFRHQCEYVAWGTRGACRKRLAGNMLDGCFHHTVKQADKHHMTGKPTPLMQRLVQCVEPGETILDPFAGSGTTGVAALLEGRRFIGIEQSEAYCEIAAQRLEAAARGELIPAKKRAAPRKRAA